MLSSLKTKLVYFLAGLVALYTVRWGKRSTETPVVQDKVTSKRVDIEKELSIIDKTLEAPQETIKNLTDQEKADKWSGT